MIYFLGIIGAFGLVLYTQFTHLLTVPGLHFDEAWQGNFAYRLAEDSTFRPSTAMNAYTSPVFHYLLALVFKWFGPSLLVMRTFCASLNIFTLFLFAIWIWRTFGRGATLFFVAFWGLLPLSVHNHRFFIEMTTFHPFCLALLLWCFTGVSHFPRAAPIVAALIAALACYAHVLFGAQIAALILIFIWHFPTVTREYFNRYKAWLSATIIIFALGISPLTFRIFGVKGLMLMLLAPLGLALLSGQKYLHYWRRLLWLGAVPFLIQYFLLQWHGVWPYAQATGILLFTWLPINCILTLSVLAIWWHITEKQRLLNRSKPNWILILIDFFLLSFLLSSLIIFKQSPRYYMIPTIIAMALVSVCAVDIWHRGRQRVVTTLVISFLFWNLFLFESAYKNQYEQFGARNQEFHVSIFHDNAQDFRPFQKVYAWLKQKNCHLAFHRYPDDRILQSMEFLKLADRLRLENGSTEARPPCSWHPDDLFLFSDGGHSNLHPLARFEEWGDLVLWTKKN